ncbi:hypothetical protein [uncultured Methylobacterium sp.]|jgi:hypothetical protein|uniref:hypothetical protein n=1 Tax=uncultured Methylobacterium sp. TaxID=157278 RepID=UPI00260F1E31|nr:hypothetical protein [uncultured Methylobacterium sp.]
MRNAVLAVATFAVCGTAEAGTLAGAQDGQYRSQSGQSILLDSKENSIGIQFLGCRKPIVTGQRLKAVGCWSNGHRVGDVDVSWRVVGTSIYSDGERYVLLPPMPPLTMNRKVDSFVGSPDAWMHNGSSVRFDLRNGKIAYDRPKPSIRSVVKAGTVLYEGDLKPASFLIGTAYAFKDGCPPASYPVRGTYTDGNEKLILRGPGPVRNGCEVVAYSYDSPHATLSFDYVVGD